MTTVPRNAPCPCGSGKKYKSCHLNKKVEVKSPRVVLPVLMCLGALGLGGYVAVEKSLTLGFSVAVGAIIIIGLFTLLRDPPPPGKGGDPGAINFGG